VCDVLGGNKFEAAFVHLSGNPTDEEILAFVEMWIDDLARGDYETAFARTAHDPYYEWTPDLMRKVVSGYGLPGPHRSGVEFNVTRRQSARGGPPKRRVERKAVCPPAFAEACYDLPLNGEWSDLTTTFRVEPCGERSRVVLQEIHVF
jgi:hypothetical protein